MEWSSHEPEPGLYKFGGSLNLTHFITLAQELDLVVILRPGPYICAERDFVSTCVKGIAILVLIIKYHYNIIICWGSSLKTDCPIMSSQCQLKILVFIHYNY